MDLLHHAVMFTGCVTMGLAHAIPWKLVLAPLALGIAGVVVVRRGKK
jgi:hypothetical protein